MAGADLVGRIRTDRDDLDATGIEFGPEFFPSP
jgi:hypothetical protein